MSGVRHKMTAFFPHDSSGEGGAQFREFGEDFFAEEEQEIYGGYTALLCMSSSKS